MKTNTLKGLLVAASVLCMPASFAGSETLIKILAERPAEDIARDKYRHPKEVIKMFDIKPGMVVAEGLPGGGWYSKILAPYLGKDGKLIGLNYNDNIWPKFGFFDEAGIKKRIAATKEFPNMVAKFTDNGIQAAGYTFETIPASLHGKVDRVLYIRALHNLSRFEDDTGSFTQAVEQAHKMLKKGGLVGVVQHRAPESASAESAKGQRGYLKQKDVIKKFEKAGFKLVKTSEINANPKDVPSDNDIVWRLPPNYIGSRNDEAKKSVVQAIGESDRMTLVFKKS